MTSHDAYLVDASLHQVVLGYIAGTLLIGILIGFLIGRRVYRK